MIYIKPMSVRHSISTVRDLFEDSVSRHADLVALQMKRKGEWTRYLYKDVQERAHRISEQLRLWGVAPGDRVAIISENCPEWGIAWFGIIYAGAIAVPIDCNFNADVVLNLINFAGVKYVFISERLLPKLEPKLKEAVQPISFLSMNRIRDDVDHIRMTAVPPREGELKELHPSEEDVVSLVFTSGTTGTPKAVMLTNKNYTSQIVSMHETYRASTSDRFLSVLPLHHVFEFASNFLAPLTYGSSVTYVESMQSGIILQVMRESRVTAMAGVPLLFKLFAEGMQLKISELPSWKRAMMRLLIMVNRAFIGVTGKNIGKYLFRKVHAEFGGCIRYLNSAGAKLDPEVTRFFNELGFNLRESYGSSETIGITTSSLKDFRIGSPGKPMKGVKVKIVDPDENGIGEVAIRGPNVMKGYFKNEEATDEVIRGGWFFIGDLGRFDDDGYLYITGIKKNMIVTEAGKNVYPEDVEALYSNIGGVKEICVFGRKTPRGEDLYAAIIPDMEEFQRLSRDDVRKEIDGRLQARSREIPSFQRIKTFELWDGEFPKTAIKKLKRHEIADRCAKHIS